MYKIFKNSSGEFSLLYNKKNSFSLLYKKNIFFTMEIKKYFNNYSFNKIILSNNFLHYIYFLHVLSGFGFISQKNNKLEYLNKN